MAMTNTIPTCSKHGVVLTQYMHAGTTIMFLHCLACAYEQQNYGMWTRAGRNWR